MLQSNEDLRPLRPARSSPAALVLAIGLLAAPASASAADRFSDLLPANLRYEEVAERRPPTISFRRNEARAVEAPTRYRTSSFLKYKTPIGKTGLVFQMKARPNLRRLVKLEIRF